MPREEPSWWYGPAGDARVRWLRPVARIYAAVSERRMAETPRYRSRLPVICIGNFTAGGTGKTPLTLAIADRLRASGHAPAVLTRGYGGNKRGPAWVVPSIDHAHDVGDEPLLLAQSVPVLVSPDRQRGAKLIEARMPPADVILMDDGLQNPALAKDLRFAVVDGRRGLGNGEVIPAGPLRARLDVQLGYADAIVVNTPPAGTGEQTEGSIATWLRERFHGPVLSACPAPRGDVSWLRERPLLAFAGIANPQRFYDLLRQLGATVAATHSFADHYAFSDPDADDLLARARSQQLLPVTTEKDWVRLIGADGRLAELREASRPLPIRLELEARDDSRLQALLDGVIAGASSAGPAAP